MLWILAVVCLNLCTFTIAQHPDDQKRNAPKDVRGAIIITIAGGLKLADYFQWSCRTIQSSIQLFDMLVFHEGNAKLKEISPICASNVKFINLGENGLSKLIVDTVIGNQTSIESKDKLVYMLSDIIVHIPRYLVEVKPMSGILFSEWLTDYTHWTYSDPDIVWGNLADWIEVSDLNEFDVLTVAKIFDASRLFIRGQVCMLNISKIYIG